MIKYNSTKIAPKGNTPLNNVAGMGLKYTTCSGICLGIWFVRTGGSATGLRNPKKDPAMDNGTEIRNQIIRVANMVPRGTAPEECAAMRKKLRKTNVPKTMLRY